MKRIISLVLAFLLVLCFSISSFAVTADEQADDLTSGWGSTSYSPSYPTGYYQSWYYLMLYHTYQIRQNVNSIKTDTVNIYNRLGFIDSSLTSILSNSNAINSDVDSIKSYSQLMNSTLNSIKVNSDSILSSVISLVGHVDDVEDLISVSNSRLASILADTDMLQKVLADQDDLDLKNSQKENQEFIENEFFTPGSDLSVDTDKLGDFVSYSDSFVSFFDFSKYGGGSPLDQIGEGSPFTQWFSEETGKSMDPTFVASSAPDDFPWPEPDEPDEPDDPDNPDVPEPEVTSTPSITYSESTFTVSASGNGTVLMYVNGSQVSNPYSFTQTTSVQTFVVTATAQESDKLISDIARVEITVPAYVPPEPEVTATPTITYSESTFTVSAAGNGTVLMYVNGSQVSNPYVFTQTTSAQTFVVTATAQESGKLISETARVEITVPAYVPPEPEVTATPTISYSESTFTVSASGNGTVLMYVNGSQVSNPYTFTQTYEVQTFTVTATAQEDGKEISATASLNVSVPAMPRPKAPTPTLTYDEDTLTVTASLSNPPSDVVISLFVGGFSRSNPYTFTQASVNQTFVVTAYSSGGIYTQSDTATLTIIVPAAVPSFPSEPSSYSLITTYTESSIFTAPEDGWYQFEVFGASGSSGSSGGISRYSGGSWVRYRAAGGGGGGGAFASSRVKLDSGDSVILTVGGVDSSSSVNFQSSLESYDIITVTSGSSGGNARLGSDYSSSSGGSGGSGGVASGGNYSNIDGGTGSSGSKHSGLTSLSGASGGSSAVDGGNVGATSPSVQGNDNATYPANSGSSGFIKVYRGDTNVPVSTFSLRKSSVSSYDGSQIVTSFYQRRQNIFESLLKGRWFK